MIIAARPDGAPSRLGRRRTSVSAAKERSFGAAARRHHLRATTIVAVSFGDTERT